LLRLDLFTVPIEGSLCRQCAIAFWRNVGLAVSDEEPDRDPH
jgi:hypothetical protein